MKNNRLQDTFARTVRCFLGGRLYPPLVMLAFFLAHSLALEVPFAILLAIGVLLGLAFCEDLRFLVPILTGCICIISIQHTPYLPTESDYYTTGARLPLIFAGCGLFAIGFVAFVLRMRKKAAPFSSLRLKWGFFAFFAAMLFAGLFQENAVKNLLYGLGVGASFLAVYLLFGFFHPKTKENAEHFLYTLLCTGLLVAAELFLLYVQKIAATGSLPQKGDILLGWGTWTHLGLMLAVCLPSPFYFAREARRTYPLYLLAGAVMTAALLLSLSRASWLYGAPILLLAVTFLALGGQNRKRSRRTLLAVFAILLLCTLCLLPRLLAFLSAFVQFGAGDNGRFAIWGAAIRAFLAAPVFGRGFFNTDIVLEGFPPILPYLYHNTVLQMLGSAGFVGLALYLFHRAETVRLAWQKRKNTLSLFLLLPAFALVLFSITDEHMFHIYPAFIYAIALSMAEGDYDPPPLFTK